MGVGEVKAHLLLRASATNVLERAVDFSFSAMAYNGLYMNRSNPQGVMISYTVLVNVFSFSKLVYL